MIRSYQGHMPKFPASCYIDFSAQVLGDVEIGEHSSVWMNAVIRGDVNSIRIGANSNVQDCAVLHGQRHLYSVTVGDWVTIGHNATVHALRSFPARSWHLCGSDLPHSLCCRACVSYSCSARRKGTAC